MKLVGLSLFVSMLLITGCMLFSASAEENDLVQVCAEEVQSCNLIDIQTTRTDLILVELNELGTTIGTVRIKTEDLKEALPLIVEPKAPLGKIIFKLNGKRTQMIRALAVIDYPKEPEICKRGNTPSNRTILASRGFCATQ